MNRTQLIILIGLVALLGLGYVADQINSLREDPDLAQLIEKTNEVKHGEVIQRTKGGRLKTIINYDNGIKHGMSYLYHSDGETVLLEMPYERGKREGTSKKYYEGGKLYAETNYREDELHGIRTVYYRSGRVRSIVNYWNGLPGIGTKEYLTDGEEKDKFKITYTRTGNTLSFDVDPYCKETRFYIGTLIEDSFFDPLSRDLRIMPEANGQYIVDLDVYTPSFLQYQDIICSCESTQGNPIVLKRRIQL